MAGVYRNRIYWELLSNPPMVLKTMAITRCANTPKKCFQQFHFRALKARSQRIHDKLAKGTREIPQGEWITQEYHARRFHEHPSGDSGGPEIYM